MNAGCYRNEGEILSERSFACKGIESQFLKVFTDIKEGTGPLFDKVIGKIQKNTKKLEFVLILTLLLVFTVIAGAILQIIPSSPFKHKMNVFFIILIVSLVVGAFLLWLWYVIQEGCIEKKAVVLPDAKEEVVLYKLTQDGVYINQYNRTNDEEMIFLDWKKVKNMRVRKMSLLSFYSKATKSNRKTSEKRIHGYFRTMEKKFGHFPYEPKLKYDDVNAVYLLHTNGKFYSELPIPPSWHQNGVYDSFISDLKEHVDFADEQFSWLDT